jgi:hypothetical protein
MSQTPPAGGVAHLHVDDEQILLSVQATPHAPQFFTSSLKCASQPLPGGEPLGRSALQSVKPEEQARTQAELVQLTSALGAAQIVPHVPQLEGSFFLSVHAVGHSSGYAVGQEHVPLLQIALVLQALPHLPQLSGSV